MKLKLIAKYLVKAGGKELEQYNKWIASLKSFGKPGKQLWADGKTLYSYNTIIAKAYGKKLFLNTTKYSQTTSKLQSHIKQNPGNYQLVEKDEKFLKTMMKEKLPVGG